MRIGPSAAFLACAVFAWAPTVHSQTPPVPYPVKPVRFIVGPAPGSGTDIVARAIANKLSARLGESVIVENRAGAGGTLAVAAVAKAPPDGHTLLFNSAALVIHPALHRKLPYDPVRDLAPITQLGVLPQVLVVHPSLPARNVKELVALARTRPGEINFGSPGVGTNGHLAAELLQTMTGIRLTHVPYKGAGPAAIDVIAGNIQMLFTGAVLALQHARTGKVRTLAVTSPTRSTAMRDVPTIAEAGVPAYEMMSWYGVLAPAGTPRAVIDRLNREIAAVVELPDVLARFAVDGVEPVRTTPEQFSELIKVEIARIAKIVRAANIPAE
jgi:tripartite-type tricarboxylate transporter receptor subunit TctC